MPRRGENIYKRKDGRWEARLRKEDGKYKYLYARSYKEIRKKKKNYAEDTECQNSQLCPSPSRSFELWLIDICQQVKPTTYESYYHCMHRYVIPFFEKYNRKHLSLLTVKSFVDSINHNGSLSVSYKRKIISVFKTSLKKIMKGSLEYESIMESIKAPKYSPNVVKVFSIKEQRLIEKTILKYKDHRALGILLCFYTGIRLGELCALKWSDIDFEARTMSIARTVSRTKNFRNEGHKTMLLIGKPKSHKSLRKIPLPEFIIKMSAKHGQHDNQDLFILTGTVTPIDPRTYQKIYKKVLIHAGIKYRKFHAIRHSFATRALELGIDIKTLSEILGHADVSITLNIYTHSLMEQKKIAIGKLNKMHSGFLKSASLAVKSTVSQPEMAISPPLSDNEPQFQTNCGQYAMSCLF